MSTNNTPKVPKILRKLEAALNTLHDAPDAVSAAADGLTEADLADAGTLLSRLEKEAGDRLAVTKQLLREVGRNTRRENEVTTEVRGAFGVVQVSFKGGGLEAVQEVLTHKNELPDGLYDKFFAEKTVASPAKDFYQKVALLPEAQRPLVTRWVTEKPAPEPSVTFPK